MRHSLKHKISWPSIPMPERQLAFQLANLVRCNEVHGCVICCSLLGAAENWLLCVSAKVAPFPAQPLLFVILQNESTKTSLYIKLRGNQGMGCNNFLVRKLLQLLNFNDGNVLLNK